MKLVCPGRDYRFDDMDAHHDVMFQQIEGIYIDKNVSIANFKECMLTFLSAVIGRKVELRFRPCFFPFVEPGFDPSFNLSDIEISWAITYNNVINLLKIIKDGRKKWIFD